MSDSSQGPGWWLASDGKWYPPQPTTPPAAPTPPGAPGAAPAGNSTPTEAIIALVGGILSILMCGCWGIGIIAGGVGLYFGMNAKKKIAASNGTIGGAGLAQAGFICSIIGLVLSAIGLVIFVISLITGNGSFSYSVN